MDRLDGEALAFGERVRQGYLTLAAAEPGRFRVIDCSGAKEETAARVRAVLAEALELAP